MKLGMKKESFYMMAALCCLLQAACSSPLDIDTPRERIVEETRVPIKAARFLYNDGNPAGGTLFDEEAWVGEVDTVAGRLWLNGAWTVPSALRGGIPVVRLSLVLDSTLADGTDVAFVNGSGKESGSITVNMPPVANDQEFIPDGSSTVLTVRLTHDPANRRFNGVVTSSLPTVRSFSFDGTIEIEY